MAKNNLIGGSIWDEYSKVVQDRMNNPKFMGELTEEDAKKANAKLIIADFGAESCGDAVRLYWLVDEKTDKIIDAKELCVTTQTPQLCHLKRCTARLWLMTLSRQLLQATRA